jgi:NitT/TauT family transport system permease protein
MKKSFEDNGFMNNIIGIFSVIILWECIPRIFSIPHNIFPVFSKVILEGYKNAALLNKHIIETLEESIIAFILAFAIATILAILMDEYKWVKRILFYPTIAFQNIPKVALAPLLIIWFSYGMAPKIAMGVLIAFFPIFENFRIGLRKNETQLRTTLSVLGKNKWLTLWTIKLPEAVPYIITGLKIGITYAIIGVIVGEMAQPSSGLGFLIQKSADDFNASLQFAAVLTTSIVGLLLYGVVVLITNLPLFKKFETIVE